MLTRIYLLIGFLMLAHAAVAAPDTDSIRKEFAAKDATIAQLKREIANRDAVIAKLMTEVSSLLAQQPQPSQQPRQPGHALTSPQVTSLDHQTYSIYPLNAPGMLLDDAGAGTSNGNPVDIFVANGTGAQLWTFSTTNVLPAGDYNLATHGPYCLQESGSANGAPTQLWACSGAISQSWSITQDDSPAGFYQIHPASNSDECLDVAGGGTTNGTAVDTATCNGANAQQWGGL